MRKLLQIGEAAQMLGMSASQIRFYERKGLIAPEEVPENGYRLYNFQQLDQLQGIKMMRELDRSIEEITEMMADGGHYNYEALLETTRVSIESEIDSLRSKLSYVERMQNKYRDFHETPHQIKTYGPRVLSLLDDSDNPSLLTPKEIYDFTVAYGLDYSDFDAVLHDIFTEKGRRYFCLEDAAGRYDTSPFKTYTLPAGNYLSLNTAIADFDEVETSFEKLKALAKSQGLVITGDRITVEDLNVSYYSSEVNYLTLEMRIKD